jgi:DNA-binding MarR family transcriptional regulator
MEISDDSVAGELGILLERLVALLRSVNTAETMSRTASSTLMRLSRDGRSRLTALADREGVTQPAMTAVIAGLEDSGLARRDPDPADGRVVLVSITDTGRTMITRRRAERAERLAVLLGGLSPEHREAISAAIPALEALADSPAYDHPAIS